MLLIYVCCGDIVNVYLLCKGVVEVIEVVVYGDEYIFKVVGCVIVDIKLFVGMIIGVIVCNDDVLIVYDDMVI